MTSTVTFKTTYKEDIPFEFFKDNFRLDKGPGILKHSEKDPKWFPTTRGYNIAKSHQGKYAISDAETRTAWKGVNYFGQQYRVSIPDIIAALKYGGWLPFEVKRGPGTKSIVSLKLENLVGLKDGEFVPLKEAYKANPKVLKPKMPDFEKRAEIKKEGDDQLRPVSNRALYKSIRSILSMHASDRRRIEILEETVRGLNKVLQEIRREDGAVTALTQTVEDMTSRIAQLEAGGHAIEPVIAEDEDLDEDVTDSLDIPEELQYMENNIRRYMSELGIDLEEATNLTKFDHDEAQGK